MLRFLHACLTNAARVLCLPLLALRRLRAAPASGWLRVEVAGGVVEVTGRGTMFRRASRPLSLEDLRRVLDLACSDSRVRGVLLVLRGFSHGSATARSLRDAFATLRDRGKRVACYLPLGAGTLEYFIASVADTIVLGPEASIAPAGFAVQTPYFKRALERLGLEPEVHAAGRYKTAAEPFLLDSVSDVQREQLGAVLDNAWNELVRALCQGRKAAREQVCAWLNRGYFTAEAALESGLVDKCAYGDELFGTLEPNASGASEDDPFLDAFVYGRRRTLRLAPLFREPYVAVVEVRGVIVQKAAGAAGVAVGERIEKALSRVRRDSKAVGVILHVDSRGGSASASDRLRHQVERLAKTKPVVAYFSDVAASGGYMVGAAARAIVAQPTTLTGSIGVLALRLPFGPALERFGITSSTLKRGEHADLHLPSHPHSPSEHALVDDEVRAIYERFIESVAKGRGKASDAVRKVAEGRIWSGTAALEIGLVDELGGFETAVSVLKRLLPSRHRDARVKLVEPPESFLARALAALPGTSALAALPEQSALARLALGAAFDPTHGSIPARRAWEAWTVYPFDAL